jgi:serine/threonine-protein kinase
MPQANQPLANSGQVEADSLTRLNNYIGVTLDDRYQLTHLLGRGGMGAVFGGRHLVIGHRVAVKIIDGGAHTTNQRALKRFFLEAQSAAAIGHPNIVQVLDVGVSPSGDPYLVMEYLEGEDLSGFLEREGALDVSAAAAILEPILGALSVAHAKNILHRDIKPGNVFLVRHGDAPPTIKLIDFGIAKRLDTAFDKQITASGALLGTPAYMAPEQAKGSSDLDARTDLYALGVMLFQMVCGKLPYDGKTYNEILFKITNEEPEVCGRSVDDEVTRLVLRAIAKAPEDRFQSATELLEQLTALEAWHSRRDALIDVGHKIHARSSESSVSSDTPTEVSPRGATPKPLSSRSQQASELETKADTTGTSATPSSETLSSAPTRQAPTSNSDRLLWLLALAIIAAIPLLAWWQSATTQAPVEVQTTPADRAAAAIQSVEIEVSGAPSGAKILYDGAPVKGNPFRVRANEVVMPIRVEAEGYDPFTATVVPNQDTVVRVSLTPTFEPAAAPDVSVETESDAPATKHRPQIGKSGRDSLYVEQFE